MFDEEVIEFVRLTITKSVLALLIINNTRMRIIKLITSSSAIN